MESFLMELKQDVQCSLCNDTLTEPKILPCFHIFCKPCIKRHAELIDDVNVFKCPRCKSQTPLPGPSSVEDLQPSPIHSRILKGLALVEGQKVCSVSESHSSASWYCFDCDRSMCDECKKNHSEFIKDHKVVLLADFTKEDIELVIARENPCPSHPQHRLELFCEDCDVMICLTCFKHYHKDHKTMSLEKFASNKKDLLSNHHRVIEQLRVDDSKRELQQTAAKSTKEQGEKAKEDVQETTMKLIEVLQGKQRELLAQIDEKMNTATTNLNIISHIPSVKEYINSVLGRGLASEMINIRETQCSEKFVFNPIALSSGIVFISNRELLQQVNAGLGEIQTCLKTDPMKSTILVEGELEAARQQKLIIRTKTSSGLNSINTGNVVDIHIRPEDDVEIEEKDVRTDGRIEVAFMAKVAGPLTAEVHLNGNPVSNSPLVINVKPQQLRMIGKSNINNINIGSKKLEGIAVNRENGNIAISNVSSSCVYVLNVDGDLLLTYGSKGSAPGQLSAPAGLAFLNDSDLVVADSENHRICIVNTTTGTLVKTFGKQGYGVGYLCHPCGVHVDDDGNIIVCDRDNHCVHVFTRDGDYEYGLELGTQNRFYPCDVITHNGMIYISDFKNHIIHVFEKKGYRYIPTRISTIGSEGSAAGYLRKPLGLSIDKDDNLLVCDTGNSRVQKFTLSGRLIGKTSDKMKIPRYIAVSNNGMLLVTYKYGVLISIKLSL